MRNPLFASCNDQVNPISNDIIFAQQKIDYDWNLKEQGIILSSFFFGYIVTQIPGGYMAARWGGRKVFGLGLFLASVVSFLTPVFGKFGFYGLVLARILCGLFEVIKTSNYHN